VNSTRPKLKLYILRLLPVGFATMALGALCWMIALDAAQGRVSMGTFFGFFAFGVPVSLVLSLVMMVPLSLVWIIGFESLRATVPKVQTRAAISSGIAALVAVVILMVFFDIMKAGSWSLTVVLLSASLLPLFLAVLMTWWTFSKEESIQ
jgi:hypothetical protein